MTGSRAESASESRISRIVPVFISGVWLASDVPVTSDVSDDSVSVSVSADLTDSDVASAALSDSASDVASAALFDSASDVASQLYLIPLRMFRVFPFENLPAFLHQCFRLTLWLRASHTSVFRADISNGLYVFFHLFSLILSKNIFGGRPVRLSAFCAD